MTFRFEDNNLKFAYDILFDSFENINYLYLTVYYDFIETDYTDSVFFEFIINKNKLNWNDEFLNKPTRYKSCISNDAKIFCEKILKHKVFL